MRLARALVPHCRADARVTGHNARDAYAPSMRQRIDVDTQYRRTLRGLPDTVDALEPLPVPSACRMTLDELLGAEV